MKSSKKPFWQRVIDPQAISIVKFIHSLDHGLIPCVLARNILEALRPFINIVCSALILDRLILKTPAEQMMQIVFWMVGLNFVCSMLVALLDWVEKRTQGTVFAGCGGVCQEGASVGLSGTGADPGAGPGPYV